MGCDKDVPVDVTSGGMSLLNSGAHGDRGDFHPQYKLPEVRTGSATVSNIWLPIIDKQFALDTTANMLWKGFDLDFFTHDGRTDTVDQPAGIIRINFHVRSDKTFHASACLLNEGVKFHANRGTTRYGFGEDLVRLYVTTIDAVNGVFRLRAYMRGTSDGCTYFLKVLKLWQNGNVYTTAAFANPHMLSSFRYLAQNTEYLLTDSATAIPAASLPAEDASTKLVRMQTNSSLAVLDSLPTAYDFWRGKIVLVPTTSFGDVAYQCVESNVPGTFRWDQARPILGTAPPGSGTWTVGMRVTNSAPSVLGAGGSQYIVDGWVCTVAGTPGTWVARRTLTGT